MGSTELPDTSQQDTDAGFKAYVETHPEEFIAYYMIAR